MREEAVQQAPAHDCSPVGVTECKRYFLPSEGVALDSKGHSVADTWREGGRAGGRARGREGGKGG